VDSNTIAEGGMGFLLIELTDIGIWLAWEGIPKDILCGVSASIHRLDGSWM